MKKTIILLLTAICVSIFCIGCSPAIQSAPEIDEPLPWVAYVRTFVSETSSYKVTKYFMQDENNKFAVTDENSYLTYTLTQSTDETNTVLYTLKTEFSITYTNSEYISDDFRNKTDKITSEAVFRRDNLAAVYTKKEASLETAPSNSYSFTADYNECSATFTSGDANKTMKFAKGTYIDNEYLYFYVRAMKSVGSSMNQNFNVVNWYECFNSNKFASRGMTATYQNADAVTPGNEELGSYFVQTEGSSTKTISCLGIRIMLSGIKKTGGPLYVYYSTNPYETTDDGIVKSSKKVIAKMLNFEYTTSGIVNYSTEYILNDFTRRFTSDN